jgi:hypothetical protein
MDTIQKYLTIVPLPILLFGPIAVIAAFMLVPGRLRLPLSLAVMVFWMPFSQYQELGFIAALAKTTGFGVYLLVIVAAVLHPGPKRDLPPISWLYIGTSLMSFFYIFSVTDFQLALATRVQWLIMVVAAIAVVRTVVDGPSLLLVLKSLTAGYALALLVPLSALILHPADVFRSIGRFEPHNIAANHIGTIFSFSAPLLIYFGLTARQTMMQYMLYGLAASAIGMGILTASRSTVIVLAGTCLPLFAGSRRGMLAFGTIAVLLVAALSLGLTESVALERLQSLETGRLGIAIEYMKIVAERPFFGLLGSEGHSFEGATEIGLSTSNPHNAYMEILFLGGLSYAIPMFVLVGYTAWAGFKVWRYRHWLGTDPVLINMMVAIMAMIYAHGFVNRTLISPTTELAPYHVILSLILISIASDITRGVEYPLASMDEYEEWDFDDDVDFTVEPAV